MLKLHLKIANLATQLISCVFAHLRPVVSLRELLPERAYFGVHLLFLGLHRVELMAQHHSLVLSFFYLAKELSIFGSGIVSLLACVVEFS